MDALDSVDPLARRRSSGPSPFDHLLMPDAHRLTVASTEDVLNVYRKLDARSETPRDEMMASMARMNLGRAHLLAGQISEAQRVAADLEKSADRLQWMVLQTRAEIAVETGQSDDARRALAALRERPERASRPARLLGNLYERRETRMQIEEVFARSDVIAARALFEQLVPMRPTGFDADVAAFEARLLLLEAKPSEAVTLARAAVDTMRIRRPSPVRIQLHQTLGDALLATGQAAEAIPVLETGLALVPSIYEPEVSPRVALLHLALAEARLAVGDRSGAKQSLATGRAILAKHPVLGPQYLGPLARAEARIGAG